MSNVYVYFEDLPGVFSKERNLLELCRKSWEKQGWTFNVLTRQDAKTHPLFEQVAANKQLVLGSPTVNTAAWQRCSYYRWLALFEKACGGLLIDYDMINYSLSAENFIEEYKSFDETTGRRYHGRGQFTSNVPKDLCPPTPCLIGSQVLGDIINLMANYEGEPSWDFRCFELREECTDQLLLHHHGTHVGPLTWVDNPWCHMYGSRDWKNAPVVHYTHWSIAQGHTADRLLLIQLERPL